MGMLIICLKSSLQELHSSISVITSIPHFLFPSTSGRCEQNRTFSPTFRERESGSLPVSFRYHGRVERRAARNGRANRVDGIFQDYPPRILSRAKFGFFGGALRRLGMARSAIREVFILREGNRRKAAFSMPAHEISLAGSCWWVACSRPRNGRDPFYARLRRTSKRVRYAHLDRRLPRRRVRPTCTSSGAKRLPRIRENLCHS